MANETSTILSGVALTVARLFILSKLNSIPSLKPVALAMNFLGTYSVVHRAFTELNKCFTAYEESKSGNNWKIAQNIFVHGVNFSCSLYNSYSIFHQYMGSLLERLPRGGLRNRLGGKIPSIDPSQVSKEVTSFADKGRKITVVTAYDNGVKEYADLVVPNQRKFAQLNEYDYVRYEGNLSENRAPYWSKIVAIWDQLQKTKQDEWIAWMDASAVITNTDKNFDQIIEQYGKGKILF